MLICRVVVLPNAYVRHGITNCRKIVTEKWQSETCYVLGVGLVSEVGKIDVIYTCLFNVFCCNEQGVYWKIILDKLLVNN